MRNNPASGSTIRLFTAIDLPDEVKSSLERLHCDVPGVRMVKPEHLHLTLRFIGETDRALFDLIRHNLAGITLPSFTFNLNSVGCFPASGPPRVLWAGIEWSEALHALRNQVEDVLVATGCAAESRRFSPHITLARPKDIPRSLITPFLVRYAGFSQGPIHVTEFRLYSSVLAREGTRHIVEASYPLQRRNSVPRTAMGSLPSTVAGV